MRGVSFLPCSTRRFFALVLLGRGNANGLSAVLAILLAIGLSGCAGTPPLKRDDPLIGQIIDTRSGESLTVAQLEARAAAADVIYLGEKHDNAEQHRLQKQVLDALIARGIKPALGFEFFDTAKTGYLTQYVQGQKSLMSLSHGKSTLDAGERLRRQLGWDRRDDRDWQFYFQLIELAKTHQLPIFGADLPSALSLRISRSGLTGLNAVEAGTLRPTVFDDAAYRELMYEKFRNGHCGWGEEPLLTRLYATWLARNDRMAESVVSMWREDPERPVVLIVGNGHVQHDQGVYERVAHRAPGVRQLNIGLREIAVEQTPLAAYLEGKVVGSKAFAPDHQILWFTQREDYADPCAGLNLPKAKK